MEVYVKESLHVLDYKNKIVDSIFLSDDKITPGYAYDITITEANTGYSDLKFNMPNMIIDNNGNKVHNPKLKLLTPSGQTNVVLRRASIALADADIIHRSNPNTGGLLEIVVHKISDGAVNIVNEALARYTDADGIVFDFNSLQTYIKSSISS